MREKTLYETIVAIPQHGLAECVSRQLQQHKNLKVTTLKDSYDIHDTLRSIYPDLVLISPVIISDPILPIVRDYYGLDKTKFVAYCTNLFEEELTRNYDAKILITDSSNEFQAVIEDILSLNVEKEEEQVLTPREKEVVIAVVKGMTNKEIADELCLSTHTIITHRRNIARKLDIHSPSGLTIYAIMNKLIELDEIMK